MIKGTPELIADRREVIINACEKLYQTMSFKEITLKEIGKEVPFSRPTIYNYFPVGQVFIHLIFAIVFLEVLALTLVVSQDVLGAEIDVVHT